MYPWMILLLVMAAVVFIVDFLLRRKKWKDNSKEEKISLIINMFSVVLYFFLSILGMLWGIAAASPESAFGTTLYYVTLVLAGIFFIIAIAAIILSLVFRKKGKVKASIWVNIIALLYIVVVLAVNFLVGELL